MGKRVYVFGAGASQPAGLPLIRDLLLEALTGPYWYGGTSDDIQDCQNVFEYLRRKTGRDYEPKRDDIYILDTPLREFCDRVNAEDLLASIEADTERDNLFKVKSSLSNLLFKALQPRGTEKGNCYPEFFKRFFSDNPSDSTILSFNYDTLPEEAMLHLGLGKAISYEIEFPNIENWPGYGENSEQKIKLIKLHGSFNWSKCANCERLSLCWYQRVENIRWRKCVSCHSEHAPVIIAPGAGKVVSGNPYDKLWSIAQKDLAECEHLVIIGYAFREADVQAQAMFKGALGQNESVKLVEIVDPSAEMIKSRLLKLCPKLANKKIIMYKGFKEYLS